MQKKNFVHSVRSVRQTQIDTTIECHRWFYL